jgi:hypothetical protein
VSGVPQRNLAVTSVSEKPAASIFRDEERLVAGRARPLLVALAAKGNCLPPLFNRHADRQFIQLILAHNKDDYVRKELTYVTVRRKIRQHTPAEPIVLQLVTLRSLYGPPERINEVCTGNCVRCVCRVTAAVCICLAH